MPEQANANQVSDWLRQFESALRDHRIDDAIALFSDDCYWRDLIAFTWNIVTFEGREQIASMLAEQLSAIRPRNWSVSKPVTQTNSQIEAWIEFETDTARANGHLRLSNGKCHTLLTAMTELKHFEEKKGPRRVRGVVHGAVKGRKNWRDQRELSKRALGYTEQPYCVIIGGGQGGIALGARLRRLNVPTIILERNARAGDSWRNRYENLVLHDPVWYDHLPYLPFPDDWPVFTPKDKFGDWLEMYAKVMELNYWSSTECLSAKYDEVAGVWTVTVERAGQKLELKPRQLVFATGAYGPPLEIELPGRQQFRGEQLHSSQFRSGQGYAGKRCVVIGAGSSAHDICADLWEHDADVTMVQRSSSCVVRSETLMELGFGPLYSEQAVAAGIDTETADMTFASLPYRLMPALQIPLYQEIARRDANFYAGLKKAGFQLDFGEDGSGLMMKALRRAAGYYIDVGASELIANGEIKVKSGATITGLSEEAVKFSDGTTLPADLLVYAIGYGSMNGWVAKIVSEEMAEKVGPCWGLGSNTIGDPGPWQGELRNMWKPTEQEGLWFHGGNLHLSRHYSLYVSLQIKARLEGIPTPVYRQP